MSVISVVSLEANAVAVTLKNANTLMIRTAFMFPPLDPRPAVLIVFELLQLGADDVHSLPCHRRLDPLSTDKHREALRA